MLNLSPLFSYHVYVLYSLFYPLIWFSLFHIFYFIQPTTHVLLKLVSPSFTALSMDFVFHWVITKTPMMIVQTVQMKVTMTTTYHVHRNHSNQHFARIAINVNIIALFGEHLWYSEWKCWKLEHHSAFCQNQRHHIELYGADIFLHFTSWCIFIREGKLVTCTVYLVQYEFTMIVIIEKEKEFSMTYMAAKP